MRHICIAIATSAALLAAGASLDRAGAQGVTPLPPDYEPPPDYGRPPGYEPLPYGFGSPHGYVTPRRAFRPPPRYGPLPPYGPPPLRLWPPPYPSRAPTGLGY